MIAFLEGRIEEKNGAYAILNVGGVGWQVEISRQTHDALPPAGREVRLLIYHHITESDQRLFGFSAAGEKELFEKLITVKGIGPRMALTILSGMNAELLIRAILQGDQPALSTIPGIGKKTAERIILELRDKLSPADGGTGVSASGRTPSGSSKEAIDALEALGFRRNDAEKTVHAILREQPQAEASELIKKALATLKG